MRPLVRRHQELVYAAIAIGVAPQMELGVEAGLECARGILVDRHLCTSDPDIFAAGDVAEVRDDSTGRGKLDVLWSEAVAKGRVAGHNMVAGPVESYDEGAPLNITRLAGYKLTIMGTVGTGKDSDLKGISRGDSETWAERGDVSMVEVQGGDAHVRLALGERSIVGAVVMGDQALSFPLQELIASRADVSSILAELQAPAAPVAQVIERFYQGWNETRA